MNNLTIILFSERIDGEMFPPHTLFLWALKVKSQEYQEKDDRTISKIKKDMSKRNKEALT